MRTVAAVTISWIIYAVVPMIADVVGHKFTGVIDPYKEEYFSCEGQPEGRFHNNGDQSFSDSGFRIVADLNFDGRDDVILSTYDEGCGRAGCGARIYLQQADKTYTSIGFFLHPGAVASKKLGFRQATLVTYEGSGVPGGSLTTYQVTGDSVVRTEGVQLHFNDSKQDRDLYDRWFGGELSLHPQYARCVTGRLQWTDSIR